MYRLFYNHENVGDVLFVVMDTKSYPDKTVDKGDVTALFKQEELIGYNLRNFGAICKIKATGMIVSPEDILIDRINDQLLGAGFEKLPYCRDSGYKVAEVVKIEEHPLDERSSIVELSVGEKVLHTVTRYQNLSVGSHCVVALPECIKFDGTQVESKIVKNIPVECEICSKSDLHIGEEFKEAFLVPEMAGGADFFLD